MEIQAGTVQNININKSEKSRKNTNQSNAYFSQNTTNLPSAYTNGVSQINSTLPIAYTKIGEISVPGCDKKASVFKLANGQKVVLCPKKGTTMIRTSYNVGALNESENIRGMSHYIEHNLFNGSKNLAPGEFAQRVSEFGGYTNASTSYAETDYFIRTHLLNENSLEEMIKLNAMQTQFPTFPVDKLEKEKEPVKSEIDLYNDQPFAMADEIMIKNLLNINSQANCVTLGTKDNINSFTRDKVLDYYNTWYTPDNAVTVITGDIDTDETINLVSKYFNKQNDYSNINKRQYEPLKYTDKPIRQDIIMSNTTQPCIIMGFAIPEGTTASQNNKINLLSSILFSPNSRLSKELDKYGISCGSNQVKIQNKQNGTQVFEIMALPAEKDIENVLNIIYKEIEYISNNPPTMQEFSNAQKKLINSLDCISEDSATLNYILAEVIDKNDYNHINNYKNDILNTTPGEISQIAKQFLDLNKVSICVSHEKSATNDSINQNYNNKTNNHSIVSFGAYINPKQNLVDETNKIESFRLWNNIETSIIPSDTASNSGISINFKTDEINWASSPALSVLTEMLSRGSAFNGIDVYENIKQSKDIALDFDVNSDGILISSSILAENIPDSLALIKETIQAPNFSQTEFERAKQIIRDLIVSSENTANSHLFSEIFGKIKSYDSKEEQLKQIDSLTLADIQNLYAYILSTSQVHAVLAAPVDKNPNIKTYFNNALSSWQSFMPFTKENSASYNIYKPNTEKKYITSAEEKAQADIAQAYTFKEVKNVNDIAKIQLLNIILGSNGLSSRLFQDLRENKKLAYSVDSDIQQVKDTKAIILKISTTTESHDPNEGSPENAKLALEGFDRNVNLLKTQNVSQKELDNAKNVLKNTILNYMDTYTAKIASFNALKNSPYDIYYLQELYNAIDNITPDDIKSAANYIFANPPITSIVASKKTLDALNLK